MTELRRGLADCKDGVLLACVVVSLVLSVACSRTPAAKEGRAAGNDSARLEGRALAEVSAGAFADAAPGLAAGVVLRIQFPGVDVIYAATGPTTRALSWNDVNEALTTNVFLEPGPPMPQYNVVEKVYAPGYGTWVPMGGIHHCVVNEGVLQFASSAELRGWLHRNTEGRRDPEGGDHAFTYLNAGANVLVGLGLYPSNGVMGFEVWTVRMQEGALADGIPPTPELVRVLDPLPAKR